MRWQHPQPFFMKMKAAMTNTLPTLGYGLVLRSQHWDAILASPNHAVDWFEIISENFMHNFGYARDVLGEIARAKPVVMHGVSLSIGSSDALDLEYVKTLKALADWVNPPWISDHICWTGINHTNTHDLLPLPYTRDSLANCVAKTREFQSRMERPLLLENPSNYMEFADNTLTEWQFVNELLEQADCHLLLDINNVYVTCFNHRLEPKTYIDSIDPNRIAQIHLAGHEHHGSHLIDTHNQPVHDDVLALYHYTMQTKGFTSTMLEWDADIPNFATMLSELERIKTANQTLDLPNFSTAHSDATISKPLPYHVRMQQFQQCVLQRKAPADWVKDKPEFSSNAQMNVYQLAYRKRLFDSLQNHFPETLKAMGQEDFNLAARSYIEATPSQFRAMEPYLNAFATFLKTFAPTFASIAQTEASMHQLRDKPQPLPLTPQQFAQAANGDFATINLQLTPACLLTPRAVYLCQKSDIFRQPLEPIEYETLKAIAENASLEDAMHTLYERDLCDENSLIPTVQQVLTTFMPKGFFILAPSG